MRSNTCERRRWEGVRFSRSLCKRKGMESGLPPAPPSALQLVRVHTKRLVVFHPLQTLASPHGRRRNESHKRRQVSWTLFGSLITATFTNYKITSPLLQQVLIISGRKCNNLKMTGLFLVFNFLADKKRERIHSVLFSFFPSLVGSAFQIVVFSVLLSYLFFGNPLWSQPRSLTPAQSVKKAKVGESYCALNFSFSYNSLPPTRRYWVSSAGPLVEGGG